eukprot:2237223-Rhodomonas_salina.2
MMTTAHRDARPQQHREQAHASSSPHRPSLRPDQHVTACATRVTVSQRSTLTSPERTCEADFKLRPEPPGPGPSPGSAAACCQWFCVSAATVASAHSLTVTDRVTTRNDLDKSTSSIVAGSCTARISGGAWLLLRFILQATFSIGARNSIASSRGVHCSIQSYPALAKSNTRNRIPGWKRCRCGHGPEQTEPSVVGQGALAPAHHSRRGRVRTGHRQSKCIGQAEQSHRTSVESGEGYTCAMPSDETESLLSLPL